VRRPTAGAATLLAALALGCGRPATAASPAPAPPAAIRVFAAASLEDALGTFSRGEEERGGARAAIHLASSSVLAKQVLEGARCDVLAVADPAAADAVERAGLAEPGSRVVVASNRLVVAVPATLPAGAAAPASLADLGGPGVRRLALGDPAHVPAGKYARAALERAGAWEAARPKVVAFDDVRRAAAACAAGETDAAVVYATDAAAPSSGLRVAAEIPGDLAPPVVVVALLVRGASPAARGFLDAMAGPRGRAAFAAAGFAPPGTR
jgi:molybdate transport system substrate-binding protein